MTAIKALVKLRVRKHINLTYFLVDESRLGSLLPSMGQEAVINLPILAELPGFIAFKKKRVSKKPI